MRKLLISDITIMGRGYCVIGLEHREHWFRSVRPLPPRANSWARFPYRRGEILHFLLSLLPTEGPHKEDRPSTGVLGKAGQVSEKDLVGYLRRAEVAENLSDLFGCAVHENPRGSGIYVEPNQGARSICGFEMRNIRIQLFPDAVRATLLLPSGEPLRDLPVVDRDWIEFIGRLLQKTTGVNRLQRANHYLNVGVPEKVLNDPNRFVRIGLTRLHNKKHWLMLDSLFPLPQMTWLNELT